ncbi:MULTISPECIES: TauD/TfdA family dioxygenase [unclassified Kitasatospora]|uniref:TauD/TfdA family dioxygenase n=1 Tax=unclassified Kitasatospora TaxID=2633591 RepID=UPI0033D05E45
MNGTLPPELAVLGPCTGRVEGNADTAVVVYRPAAGGLDIAQWATEHRPHLMDALATYGAVLVRGVVHEAALLNEVAGRIGGELLTYNERSTPRTQVSGNVYTSTEYPAAQTIVQHNESAYSDGYPLWLFFASTVAAETGGETPLADSRAVARRLPASLVGRFRAKGVLYTRAYREGMGLTWQESYQTEDRAKVEEYCRSHGIEWTWTEDGLRTRHRRPALITDPRTGEESWFNQAHLFHSSNLPKETREALEEMFDPEDMPRGAYYGDGTPIPDEELDLVRQAFEDSAFAFPWVEGDLLMVNNLLVSHGRRPYTGKRTTLVAMAGNGHGDA